MALPWPQNSSNETKTLKTIKYSLIYMTYLKTLTSIKPSKELKEGLMGEEGGTLEALLQGFNPEVCD